MSSLDHKPLRSPWFDRLTGSSSSNRHRSRASSSRSITENSFHTDAKRAASRMTTVECTVQVGQGKYEEDDTTTFDTLQIHHTGTLTPTAKASDEDHSKRVDTFIRCVLDNGELYLRAWHDAQKKQYDDASTIAAFDAITDAARMKLEETEGGKFDDILCELLIEKKEGILDDIKGGDQDRR